MLIAQAEKYFVVILIFFLVKTTQIYRYIRFFLSAVVLAVIIIKHLFDFDQQQN